MYQVANWSENFEGAKSKTYKNKSSCQMPTKHGLGYKRLIKSENGPALFGAWCALIQVLSRQPCPRQGYLTDTGGPDGIPLVSSDIELLTDIPSSVIDSMLQVCSDQRVGWLRNHADITRIPQETEVSERYPLDSDSDLDSDSEGAQVPRERFPQEFAGFIRNKGHDLKRDIVQWSGVWANICRLCPVDPVEVFRWANQNYSGAAKPPRFFMGDTWPNIINAYNNRGKSKDGDYDWQNDPAYIRAMEA